MLQFHYTTWPDFKVPTLSAFLNYLHAVRQSGALSRDVGPPVIHCSAGIGRSGTFCLVDTCLVLVSQLVMSYGRQNAGKHGQSHEQWASLRALHKSKKYQQGFKLIVHKFKALNRSKNWEFLSGLKLYHIGT